MVRHRHRFPQCQYLRNRFAILLSNCLFKLQYIGSGLSVRRAGVESQPARRANRPCRMSQHHSARRRSMHKEARIALRVCSKVLVPPNRAFQSGGFHSTKGSHVCLLRAHLCGGPEHAIVRTFRLPSRSPRLRRPAPKATRKVDSGFPSRIIR